jgi:hypothetical protein
MQGSIAKVTSKTPASVEERNRRLGTSEASDRVNGRPGIISKAAGLQEAAYVDQWSSQIVRYGEDVIEPVG